MESSFSFSFSVFSLSFFLFVAVPFPPGKWLLLVEGTSITTTTSTPLETALTVVLESIELAAFQSHHQHHCDLLTLEGFDHCGEEEDEASQVAVGVTRPIIRVQNRFC